ncbi:MAG: hypothetical protein BZY75_02035 [SAR202 cluster bacterium Io17-Chloro-G7]|nr:MAG: hypothetical protein BZY75_02035 [SAR202 cluster bacterium Io17-Chloro-G7]
MAMLKRRLIANAQLSKALWTIADQLRTQGTLATPSMDALTAAAILAQIAIIIETLHPTTQNWFNQNLFNYEAARRGLLQSADPDSVWNLLSSGISEDLG